MKQIALKQYVLERFRSIGRRFGGTLSGAVILMYHGVVQRDEDPDLDRWNITQRELGRHLRFLSETFQIISLDTVVKAIEHRDDLPANSVVITFDDALSNVFMYARPMLKDRGLPYVVAAPAGLVDSNRTIWSQEIRLIVLKSKCRSVETLSQNGTCQWLLDSRTNRRNAARQIVKEFSSEEPAFREKALEHLHAQLPTGEFGRLLEQNPDLRIMNSTELRQLRDEGVTIAAHGWLHTPLMDCVNNLVLHRETATAKERLEALLETRIEHFVFPHGHYSSASIEALKKSGYRSALTTRAGCVQPASDVYMLPRIAAECTLSHLRSRLLR